MSKTLRQRLISGGAWAFSGRVLALVSGLMINGLLARLLPPGEMGVYFLASSLILFSSRLAQLGMMRSVVRLISESLGTNRQARARSAVTNIFFIATVSIAVVAGGLTSDAGRLIAQGLFKSSLMAEHMNLIAVWLIVFALQSLLAESFRGFSDIRFATIFDRLLTSLISVILFGLLWIITGQSDLGQVLLFTVLAYGASLLFGCILLRKRVLSLDRTGQAIGSGEILRISLPLLGASLAPFLVSQGGLWILGAFRPHEEVAIFAAVARLVALVSMPLLVVNAVMAPVIAEMYAQGKRKELEYYLRRTATLAGWAAIGVLLLLMIFGSQVLGIVYGEHYQSGYSVLVILSIGTFVNVWSGSCGQALMMTGGQKIIMYISLLSGLLMITCSLLVVDRYGVKGVALVASSATAFQFILFTLYARMHTGLWTHMKLSIPWLWRVPSR